MHSRVAQFHIPGIKNESDKVFFFVSEWLCDKKQRRCGQSSVLQVSPTDTLGRIILSRGITHLGLCRMQVDDISHEAVPLRPSS